VYLDDDSWEAASTWGTADTNGTSHVYVENNEFLDVLQTVDIASSSRSVIRKNFGSGWSIIHHGNETGHRAGARYAETWGNTFTKDSTVKCAPDLPTGVTSFTNVRSGSLRFFNNAVPNMDSQAWGTIHELNFSLENLRRATGPYACWTGGYPTPHQTGWGYVTGATTVATPGQVDRPNATQDLEPILVWGNSGTGNYNTPRIINYPCNVGDPWSCDGGTAACSARDSANNYVVNNREYYLANANYASSPTTGIGSGNRSARPSTCTAGTYWFSTDQGGNWDPDNANANDGALDKCTGDAWTNDFYIPKTYPHTLAVADGGGGGGDVESPVVSITAPLNAATVAGTISVTATASDNVGVSGVQFKLDGNDLGAEDTSAPFSISWDTTGASEGSHALTAVARDAAANTTTSTTITVTVDNIAPHPRSKGKSTTKGNATVK
jgi:hypothetical protein